MSKERILQIGREIKGGYTTSKGKGTWGKEKHTNTRM
jgi:hypothetical protein